MHRKPLLALLADYGKRYPDEMATMQRFADFVQNHDDCFQRSLLAGHVTGSAWVANRAGTHVLLTHHRKLDRWLQLGGHADGDADIAAVATREAHEESGIDRLRLVVAAPEPGSGSVLFDIDIHPIPARGDEPGHFHYDARVALQATDSETVTVSDESHALAWVELARLRQTTQEDSILRMAEKWQHLVGCPQTD